MNNKVNNNLKITKYIYIFLILFLISALIYGSYIFGKHSSSMVHGSSSADTTLSQHSDKKVLYWYDPMFPAQKFDKPGKSPYMDMQLVAKYAQEENSGSGENSGINIPANISQSLGVKLAKVERGIITNKKTIPAITAFNDRKVAIVQARTGGFVENVSAIAPGDFINAGAHLTTVLLPDWQSGQLELLALANMPIQNIEGLISAAKQKLKFLGMSEREINQVWQSKKVINRQTISAPISGVVREVMVRAGMNLEKGQTLITINGINPLWIEGELPIDSANNLKVGQLVNTTFQGRLGDNNLRAKIINILPQVDEKTRTLKIRAQIDNPKNTIPAGLLAQMSIEEISDSSLLVPQAAVIRTGLRNIVIVAKDNHYQPVEVVLGQESADKIVVTSGLAEGEQIIESGQFLIDSEASLNGIIARLSSKPDLISQSMNTMSETKQINSWKNDDTFESIDHSTMDHSSMENEQMSNSNNLKVQPTAEIAEGIGKIISVSENELTIAHQDIPKLNWPAMTMPFPVKEAKMLSGLKTGDEVKFSVAQYPDRYEITNINKSEVKK